MMSVQRLEALLDRRFQDPHLAATALRHASALNEPGGEGKESNERLAFLGDSVLSFLVTARLYQGEPDAGKAELTQRRIEYINNGFLAARARALGLGPLLEQGQGQAATPLAVRTLAQSLEAVVGACFLDGGLEFADHALDALVVPRATA